MSIILVIIEDLFEENEFHLMVIKFQNTGTINKSNIFLTCDKLKKGLEHDNIIMLLI